MKLPPDYQVRCSCGKSTILHWNGSRYESTSQKWMARYPEGWTCGHPDHHQRVPPTRLTPYKQASKIKATL